MSKYLYVAKCDINKIKIGISASPHRRVLSMQTGNPHEITLLAQFESSDPEETEYRLHKALRYRRIRGEWFTFAPDEIATLLYLIENEFHVYEAMGQVDYACDSYMDLMVLT